MLLEKLSGAGALNLSNRFFSYGFGCGVGSGNDCGDGSGGISNGSAARQMSQMYSISVDA